MNITSISLERVDNHWAVKALTEKNEIKGIELANHLLVKTAIGEQIHFDFSFSESDYEFLNRLSLAYELAATEGIRDFLNTTSDNQELREQCASGAYRSFAIRRLLKLPSTEEQKILHILHISALAYCGERWSDLRRWYNENDFLFKLPSVAEVTWDSRLLTRLFDCWVRLFRKQSWDDLDRIHEIIAGLRDDQKSYEASVLEASNSENRAMALRLISLYHWAKATEIQAKYTLQGEPADVTSHLNKHFELAIEAAAACGDSQLEMLLLWLQVAGRQMIGDSIWWVGRRINSRVTKFLKTLTKQQSLFELLPPQRLAIQRYGLLDQAATAIVVDLPTSGGKTLLAQFRILQALNQFDNDEVGKGWVAYVAPTRALASQITRRLRRDFEPIGVKVEQLSGAIEIDAFEEDLLSQTSREDAFDVLVSTPEKLQLIIRNKKIPRTLALVVMDEAHNIEDENRGLRIELLLATIKGECTSANFLLLMPYVEKPETLARWLAQDVNAGRAISLGTVPWRPNDLIVGIFKAESSESERAGWRLKYETLVTTPKTIHLSGEHFVGGIRPLKIPKNQVIKKGAKQDGFTLQTVAMASIMSDRGTSIAVANNTEWAWSMARKACEAMTQLKHVPNEIRLVQNFLRNEISSNFELIDMLSYGVGVHHSGLSDEVRALIEWLVEEGHLRLLCATTTIAQGLNFPVSSVFLASNKYPYGKEMPPREFWNLAGRAGRIGHDSVGVVGIASGTTPEKVVKFLSQTTGELVSRLVKMLDDLEIAGKLNDLDQVFHEEQWEDFRCYVAHLWSEKKNLDAVLSSTEQLLRNTFGYVLLEKDPIQKRKADKLLEVTKNYAKILSKNPGHASLADMTGFSPEGVSKALAEINSLENKLTPNDWKPESLFGAHSGMADMYSILLKIPQLKEGLEEITKNGIEHTQIAELTKAWVNGTSIEDIARDFFMRENQTKALTAACKAIYKTLVNNGTWGISALSRLSGIDFKELTEKEQRKINMIPAMIYHGVQTEEAVLMRMNFVPRSIAESLGKVMKMENPITNRTVRDTRLFLQQAEDSVWNQAKPKTSFLTGEEYKKIWEVLSGDKGRVK
ncbi:TPA: DEAD/DEAH box helicase [Legionella pneumophila]|uniref:DEAD/DEAH box helicase n=1 Tax=Legionella pneumophila TaxID=446 RepID=UPI0007709C13|nr:DEAD/DEAH box helicase [Legionella pneumophila]CZG70250.1 ski2-like helicase [Legionella pneumophila]CZH92590.1 ski2-like helicase [Legionella pneumophila]HAT1720501.1 DEAD/DEAH box helicase [Legionella pneumophila]HAT8612943.1 DEAD/DEAH box helicase [Legionella pneumophila]HDO7804350.1 DEAD/DEAH box helicase [Legionella pneumophila]